MSFYSPGQVAELTGFSLDTLRYYERIGLLHRIDRTAGGRRRFTDTDVRLLLLVRCLRDTGMPVAQLRRFMELMRSGSDTTSDRLVLLEEHDRRIDQRIAGLREDQEQIRGKIRYYRSRLGAATRAADPDRLVPDPGSVCPATDWVPCGAERCRHFPTGPALP